MDAKSGHYDVQIKRLMDKGGHYDVQIKRWIQKGHYDMQIKSFDTYLEIMVYPLCE